MSQPDLAISTPRSPAGLSFRLAWGALAIAAGGSITLPTWADETIYRADSTDGIPLFSSQPYTDGYRPYLQPTATSQARPRRDRLAEQRTRLAPLIQETAQQHGIDPALVSAIIAVESAYRPNAVSPKGAVGAMQLVPATAQQYGISNPYDLQQNLTGGTRYLKDLLATYGGNLPLVLAAYNAGQGNVRKHNQRIPPFSETMLYVPRVLAEMAAYQRQDDKP